MICGDDGVTYDDACAMEKSSCTERKTIKMMHVGKCGKLSEILPDFYDFKSFSCRSSDPN